MDTKSLGQILKNKRKSLGLTQVAVSDMTGLGVRFISEVEGGKATAEIGKVILYAEGLGLTLKISEKEIG